MPLIFTESGKEDPEIVKNKVNTVLCVTLCFRKGTLLIKVCHNWNTFSAFLHIKLKFSNLLLGIKVILKYLCFIKVIQCLIVNSFPDLNC